MEYQWYPGHMTKTVRELKEQMKLIDLVIEIADARIPMSGRNPDLDSLAANKVRLLILGKKDLADEAVTNEWLAYFREQGLNPIAVDLRRNADLKMLNSVIRESCKAKIERDKRRGIMNRPIRALVAGIPNVGKSTFINSFSGSSSVKTGNKPGVTKGRQWIRLKNGVELMDTPGLLWPKFEDPGVGEKIALIGSIPDAIMNTEELSLALIRRLDADYPELLSERYGGDLPEDPAKALEQIAKFRGCLKKGGEADTEKAASLILDDFRHGRIGRITLERP